MKKISWRGKRLFLMVSAITFVGGIIFWQCAVDTVVSGQTSVQSLVNLIQEGDFEVDSPLWFGFGIEQSDERAHNGTFSAKLAPREILPGYVPSAFIYQSTTIPTDTTAAMIRFYWLDTNIDADNDALFPAIMDESLSSNYFEGTYINNSDGTWRYSEECIPEEVLTAIKGQTVYLFLFAQSNGVEPEAVFYVDDVEFIVSNSGEIATVSPTPTPTVSPTPTSTQTPTEIRIYLPIIGF